MIEELKTVLLKDLASLRREVEQYPDDAALWRPLPGIANPGGNLALHLAGNLQWLIGAQLGGTGYVRDRDWEFAVRDLPRARVLQEIDAAAKAVETGLAALDPAALGQEFPLPMGGKHMATSQFLLNLCSHLAYHLGQVDYHRRMV
jgi:DinB superfamily